MSIKRNLILFFFLCFHADLYAFQLEETTISRVHAAIKNHEITCEQLVSAYIERIKRFDLSMVDSAPINAVTEINPSALQDARSLDENYVKTRRLSGSLHCVPVILKDNLDSYDTTTTTGSYALLGNQPVNDAYLTALLRKAGAIVLAKGGMDEFAWGMMGISSRNGRIGNAYHADLNPGGSSGGPAAAVSANFALAGIGSDNSGSVRIPAVYNGLIGLRPGTGLISQSGLFPMGKMDGVAGPMTRTVEDLARILDVIARPDPQDEKTLSVPRVKTYAVFLNSDGLRGKRIGIVRRVGGLDTFRDMPDNVAAIMQKTYARMKNLGAVFINVELPEFNSNRDLNQAGEIQDVNRYLSSFPAVRKNFRDICESDRTRNFGSIKSCLAFMSRTSKQTGRQIRRAQQIFANNKSYVTRMMNKHHLDALLIPISTRGVANYDAMSVNTWRAPVSSNSGLPSIAFPVGYLRGLPVGIELIGKENAEPLLIQMVYAHEQHSRARPVPVMPPPNERIAEISAPEFNNVINQLGRKSYDSVLKASGNDEKKLTPEVFRRLAKSVLLQQ
ncbi:Glutamyl-tRNA(Gln) amidotransferase subunit A [Aquicella siphonis]|uniref:Glutamyl-tRNA(Gln) amidotransferase subunit A n=1 Tax=Aquicella siphonis TaxID=254247 RepID=A0A5E4PIJ3_9COXI|nr:amidase family protein [Aquicella siphonis]VVC76202.1 Glutamyl-tRNA(Gln) amidotransferase subunit A [Aquicella siphonis]